MVGLNVKICVLMTTYNGADFLVEQIDSLINLDVDFDLHIYDDKSNDETISIINSFMRNHKNIFLVNNQNNSGGTGKNIFNALGNYNIFSSYDYIALADQDDIWLNNKLSVAIRKLKSENANLYFSNLTLWNEKRGEFGYINKSFNDVAYDHIFAGGSAGCTYVFDSNLYQILYRYLNSFDVKKIDRLSHDWIIYFVAKSNNLSIYKDSNSYIKYRIHGNNQYGVSSIFSISAVLAKYKKIKNGFFKTQLSNYLLFCDKFSYEHKIISLLLTDKYRGLFFVFLNRKDFFRSFSRFLLVYLSLVFYV